ncbi:2-C-methyl-D-erythritol 2,4-cyclodiphosphate synthase [Natronogracilivirga saccharolytica]|uniref:2-C-methyl-D-erythritol 2,4-cyclodiphosphate synthase n=1 Tax=Natronogracilivirga saccharolytica TaxID=2812953 RepID=A0A8J7S4W1_9BACT|nr:2-C-methyl-D-erythritol 2,4-cyclodiphosphate synthase [Natronogracilivirga saccharolytica]MBP3192028.1 2-C-methyl-D-erythritol 2,4-cyclodiphosphate synthase [Natronogracilivirga saccharolytica]
MVKIGYGYDIHRLKTERRLVLGGVDIPFEKGLDGHSDADVLLHAITDAILGALALGDIGSHFPDTDPAFRDADSRVLLREVMDTIREKGYAVGNVDATVVAEYPKLLPYTDRMRHNIAEDLQVTKEQVSVKATTSEKMGMLGRGEGISAAAVCLLVPAGKRV